MVEDAVAVDEDDVREEVRAGRAQAVEEGEQVGRLAEGEVARNVRQRELHHFKVLVHDVQAGGEERGAG